MFDKILRIETGPDWQVYVHVAFLLVGVLLASTLCYYVTRTIMLLIVSRLARHERHKWMRAAERHKVFHRLAPLVPAGIIYASAPLLSGLTIPVIPLLARPLAIIAACYMVYALLRAALAFRDSIDERYSHVSSASERPIKSFMQISTIVVYMISMIAIVSLLLERSPVYLLTGLSAVTTLLIIVFRDSLLDCVASIQLAAYDMLRVGDWIEVPGYVADGTVIDIALNTIKVRNFDNTIVMLPSHVLLSNSVKNWCGMSESGARRLKHAMHFDTDTIRFPDDALLTQLHDDGRQPLVTITPADTQRLTNLGLFRRYLTAYLSAHPSVRRDTPVIVRQLQSDEPVVALEIYAFIDETRWEPYETLQSDMLDHADSCPCSVCDAGNRARSGDQRCSAPSHAGSVAP
ncbi:Small-conductance mechanosensitive channel [Candidatus Burkholderia humilis]|nr:Small-conductance mechanosensitive channel [Candidatus Burkholderia humilis]